MMLWLDAVGDAARGGLGDLEVGFVEIDDRVAVRSHGHLEGLGHAVLVGVLEAGLHLHLGHVVGRVEHDDLLGGALAELPGGERPHLGGHAARRGPG